MMQRGFMKFTVEHCTHFNLRLRRKERELAAILRGREQKAILHGSPVTIDDVPHILIQVQDALRRIQFHAYGACIACGRQIEWHLLEQTPWTPYCAEDQHKYEPKGIARWTTAAAGKFS